MQVEMQSFYNPSKSNGNIILGQEILKNPFSDFGRAQSYDKSKKLSLLEEGVGENR